MSAMRNNSYRIAVCGISVAVGTIFLTISAYLPVAKLSMLACATVALFLPFSIGTFGGGMLCYAATAALGAILAPTSAIAYLGFFGLQPVMIYLFKRFKLKLVLRLVIEAVFAALVLYLFWQFAVLLELLAVSVPLLWLELLGIPFFLAYEYLMERVFVQVGRLADKFGRK